MRDWCLSLCLVFGGLSPCAAQSGNPVVVIDTTLGPIKVELFADKAPQTVKNFLHYVNERFYDGTIFHRVVKDFMIQGGGFAQGFKEKATGPPIKYEMTNGLRNQRGTVSLARTANPDSGTVQFFINVKDNDFLDKIKPGYVVFGKVTAGLEVVDKIRAVSTGNRQQHTDVPVDDVVIRSIRLASQFTLALAKPAAIPAGKVFTMSANIEHPLRGQYLTLELPEGLERVEGKAIQPIAVVPDGSVSVVLWRIRGLRPGEYECVVRSSTGSVQSKKIKISDAVP